MKTDLTLKPRTAEELAAWFESAKATRIVGRMDPVGWAKGLWDVLATAILAWVSMSIKPGYILVAIYGCEHTPCTEDHPLDTRILVTSEDYYEGMAYADPRQRQLWLVSLDDLKKEAPGLLLFLEEPKGMVS